MRSLGPSATLATDGRSHLAEAVDLGAANWRSVAAIASRVLNGEGTRWNQIALDIRVDWRV